MSTPNPSHVQIATDDKREDDDGIFIQPVSASNGRTDSEPSAAFTPGPWNRFERYPALADWMQKLANARIEGMTLSEWDDFCGALNGALAEAERAEVADRIDYTAKKGTKITFGTEQALDLDGTKDLGLVIWLPRDAVAKALAAEAASPTEQSALPREAE